MLVSKWLGIVDLHHTPPPRRPGPTARGLCPQAAQLCSPGPVVTGLPPPVMSADVSGKLRIWDTTQKEHLLKYEYQPFAGKIKDIAWTEDSKRIAVVGEGREK